MKYTVEILAHTEVNMPTQRGGRIDRECWIARSIPEPSGREQYFVLLYEDLTHINIVTGDVVVIEHDIEFKRWIVVERQGKQPGKS